jgi:methionine aminotransferase
MQLVNENMLKGNNQYAPMQGVLELRQQIAQKINQLYAKAVDPVSEITITAGATQALFTAISAFVHAGDEVIVIEPAYDSYVPSILLSGGVPVVYELASPDYTIDWDAFAALITPKTKMIIINTPNNPTGKTLKKSDLQQLDTLLLNKNILLLSDEVYEHLIFDGQQHESVLKYPNLYAKSLLVYSFGKTFHNTGWKIGYCVGPPELMSEFRKVHQFNVFSVNTPIQYALSTFLETPEEYLSLNAFYQQKRDYFLSLTKESRLVPIACEGTYFQLFKYDAVSSLPDLEFAQYLTKEKGVAGIPVSAFFSSKKDEKVLRFCFAKTEETLERAGELIRKL